MWVQTEGKGRERENVKEREREIIVRFLFVILRICPQKEEMIKR